MSSLRGRQPKDTFTELLKLKDSGVTEGSQVITDGEGVETALSVSTTVVGVDGVLEVSQGMNVAGADIRLGGIKWPVAPAGAGQVPTVGSDGVTMAWKDPTEKTELILKANFVGAVTETIGTSRFYPPSDIVIKKVYCSISSPGTAINEFDVKVDGVSIFSGKSLPSMAANQYRSSDYSLQHPVRSTSYITVDVLRASGSDLVVYIVY